MKKTYKTKKAAKRHGTPYKKKGGYGASRKKRVHKRKR